MPTVLFSAPPADPAPDLRAAVEAAGFAVADHALGAVPAAGFAGVAAAVLAVRGSAAAAVAQTARWRAELGDEFVPVLWLLPPAAAGLAPAGLRAGADACLVEPVAPDLLAAQLAALARTRAAAARVAARAAEARLLGDQLQQAFARLDADRGLARRVHRAALPAALPAGVHVVSPRSRAGADFHDARRVGDRLAFLVGDVPGRGGAAASLLGLLALRAAAPPDADPDPAAVLARVNAELLALRLDDPPLVALLAGVAGGGTVTVARAGLPPPVWLPAGGDPEPWSAPGPFLGTAAGTFPALTRPAAPGDRLLVATGGAGDGDALLAAARRHRGLWDGAFADAVTADLLAAAPDGDDVTLVVVG